MQIKIRDVSTGRNDRYVADVTALDGTTTLLTEATATTPGLVELATNAETIAGTDTTRAVTPDDMTAALADYGWTISTAALGTVRRVHGQITTSNAAISGGSVAGVRGLVTLSGGVTAGGAYFYGAQGKLTMSGTMNHADARLCGLIAQLDISAGTYTAGQLSCLWVDAGASSSASAVSTKGGGQFNLIRITNTTTANANAVIFAYAEADYLFDLGGPGGNADWFDAGTGATSTCSGHLKVYLNGTAAYIRVYDAAT